MSSGSFGTNGINWTPLDTIFTTNSNYNYTFTNNSAAPTPAVEVKGDIVLNGMSMADFMKSVQDRLMILSPDLEQLEKFEALRDAYNQYKMLEKLLIDNAKTGLDQD